MEEQTSTFSPSNHLILVIDDEPDISFTKLPQTLGYLYKNENGPIATVYHLKKIKFNGVRLSG